MSVHMSIHMCIHVSMWMCPYTRQRVSTCNARCTACCAEGHTGVFSQTRTPPSTATSTTPAVLRRRCRAHRPMMAGPTCASVFPAPLDVSCGGIDKTVLVRAVSTRAFPPDKRLYTLYACLHTCLYACLTSTATSTMPVVLGCQCQGHRLMMAGPPCAFLACPLLPAFPASSGRTCAGRAHRHTRKSLESQFRIWILPEFLKTSSAAV